MMEHPRDVGNNGEAELIRGLLRKEDEAALVQNGTGSETVSTSAPSTTADGACRHLKVAGWIATTS